ncbi:MAG TPA: thiamine-phosphate kinase [Nitrospinaceae bacterium]|nr:thiamine-phosphate kinase [Nitrospinaceae bacterium]HIK58697.1 thiamine-phosphate kinase [Nitrospinaceae bacterium]
MSKIKELGEFKLIHRLASRLKFRAPNTIIGIGDDCAVYPVKSGTNEIISTDALVEDIHFSLSNISPEVLGRKSLAVSLSDIAAMGGTPKRVLVTLGIPKKISVSFLEKLYKGFNSSCNQFKVELVGGDTVSSPKCFFINVSIVGETKTGRLFTRHGARSGDLIFVTGTLGDSSLGLKLLSQNKNWGSSKDRKYLIETHLDPAPRVLEAGILARSNLNITSMIDISDGLVQDLYHICQASKVGARIQEDRLPQSPEFLRTCSKNQINPSPFILNGGEDYELLFTLPADGVKKLKRQFLKAKTLVTQIGEITLKSKKVILKTKDGKNKILPDSGGYNHF